MSDQDLQAKPDKGWESIVLRILKWLAILGIALFIGLTVLSRMGGNSPVLREAIEDFLTDATPYTARIGTLNSMRFFPNIVIDVTDVELRSGQDGNGETQVRIDAAKLVMPLFDAMYRPGHFKDFQIKNLKAMPGALLAQSVDIQSLAVEGKGEQTALIIEGAIGKSPLKASFGLDVKGKPGAYTYVIGRERGFDATLADISANGIIRNTVTGDYKFENLVLKKAGQEVLRGNIDFDRGDDRLKVEGQLRIEPGKSRIDPDIQIQWPDDEGPLEISGKITGPEIIISDFDGPSRLQKTIDALDRIFGTPGGKLDLNGLDVDLKLDIQQLKSANVLLGKVKTPLTIKDSKLHMGPLSGTVVTGTLSGEMSIDAAKSPAKMTQKIRVKKFDYTELQNRLSDEPAHIEGHGNILMELSSQSDTLEGLIDGLSGKISFVGGRGKMRAGLLNLWGGGLLNALLPSFEEDSDLNMNCVVVNLDIENLKGHSDAVFVDTQRVTLHGEGTYDFQKDYLEMVLEPKPKEIAIGSIGGAVNVSGPLSELKASPNIFDLGKKVGGLLLGAINPVFYAVTLADFDLADDHPCKAFVIEKETLPEPEKPSEDSDPETQAEQPETPAAEMEQRAEEMNE